MSSWHSYPSIYNVGHKAVADMFKDPVIVEEKVDGSQFSFGKFGEELRCRSKGQVLNVDAPEKMFTAAVNTAKELFPLLKDGYTYRAEYLQKPKHNSLAYDRAPIKNLIIFDISPAEETYLSYEEKKAEAERLGLEVVPLLFSGYIINANKFMELLNTLSILGSQKIEGVVAKNYDQFGPDKKVLLAKFVSEEFKEVHAREWKTGNPTSGDILTLIGEDLRTPARWNKAIQHLKERGLITDSPKDIGNLMKEVQFDVKKECEDEIKTKLFQWAWPSIQRKVIAGLAEWYKEELVKKQFGDK